MSTETLQNTLSDSEVRRLVTERLTHIDATSRLIAFKVDTRSTWDGAGRDIQKVGLVLWARDETYPTNSGALEYITHRFYIHVRPAGIQVACDSGHYGGTLREAVDDFETRPMPI